MEESGGYTSGPERGARRKKLAGYLKAANELRHSYQQSWQKDGTDEDGSALPGSFPDSTVVRSGDEEMLLFPSYAIRHTKKHRPRRGVPGGSQDIRSEKGAGDAEYWKKEWEKYEDDNSVVDIDIRGWVYSPHRGQMSRKNRIMVGIARQLSGIPAPASSRASSPNSEHHVRVEARNAKHEDEMAAKEAGLIEKKGQDEAHAAWQGRYSERPSRSTDQSSIHGSTVDSRSSSPGSRSQRSLHRPSSNSSLKEDYDPGPNMLAKRSSWRQPSDMTSAELSVANSHLMLRLKPFLATPLVDTPLTVFFYNDQASRSRTITTNDAGHFSLRAALDFVPTNVRVLASEKLSATEEVRITEPNGISIISDIDDTIKHSGISHGAREIFRNAFIRNHGDLTIDGVQEWYTTMADLGVKFHYVSNSPWQLYPVLTSYFAAAGLPKGSFHLKQYTGMLQGIFEPVAERKKGTLDKILADFPQRRFILAGDSGEADLELYTEVMLANPGRIVGVFIRDVTTTKPPDFFDSAVRSQHSQAPSEGRAGNSSTDSAQRRPMEFKDRPPPLPSRPSARTSSTLATSTDGAAMGNLIDLDEAPSQGVHRSMTDSELRESQRKISETSTKSPPPSRPAKPIALRSVSDNKPTTTTSSSSISSPPINTPRKPIPPPPPKPRQPFPPTTQEPPTQPTDPSPLSQAQNASSSSISQDTTEQSYRATARSKLSSASNALYSLYNNTPPYQTTPPTSDPSTSHPPPLSSSRPAPPIPPRPTNNTTNTTRGLSSYPAAAAQYASNRFYGTGTSTNNEGSTSSEDGYSGDPQLSKKEEMWQRRWVRAQEIFEDKGVVLRRWRVGSDVADEVVRLVERAGREMDLGGR